MTYQEPARGQPVPHRTPARGVRVVLGAFCALTAAGFTALFALSGQTDETFAWTIQPPATAAFLGAGYGAGFVLSVLALRSADWAQVRVPYLTVLTFTWLTTIATALHADRLHMVTPGNGPLAAPAAWFWVAVYVVVPVAMLVTVLRPTDGRAPAGDVSASATAVPFPRWLAAMLGVIGVLLLGVGTALYLAPSTAGALWPWALTPFTSRAVAAWLIAFGVAVALCLRDGDLARLRVATAAASVFAALQLVTVVRFADEVDGSASMAVYVLTMVCLGIAGLTGWALGRPTAARR
ncbi:MAG TPA: hypothetical protein VGK35_13320 [Actinotalea sp.]